MYNYFPFFSSVAAKSDKNLMPVSNLAVCFGPTLLRPEEETVASIMDIKFYNVVVEILIENYEKIFKSPPDPPELQSATNQTTNDLIRGSSPSTHHHQQQLNTNNYIVNNSHPHRNNSTSNIISNQQQQIQTHNQRYNHSHTSPPVTHVCTVRKNNCTTYSCFSYLFYFSLKWYSSVKCP